MSSFVIGISGSWLILAVAVIIAIVISYFYYRTTIPELPKGKKYFLFLLRALALSLLLFILFEPIYTSITSKTEEPKSVILLDNSISMKLNDGKYNRKELYKKILKKLDFTNELKNVEIISFDKSFNYLTNPDFDSLSLNGEATNISKVLTRISETAIEDNVQAIVLISDGAFNEGENPLYVAETAAIPIYAVGIGDTNSPKDISVQSILTNNILNINSTGLINVKIKANGYNGRELKVTLLDNGKIIDEQNVQIHSDNESLNLVFEYPAKTPGIHKLTVKTTALDDEITLKNNTLSEFIEVNSNKKKIMILAGAPSPDLSFIIKTLNKDKGIEINLFIEKEKSEFYKKQPQKNDFDNADIIFLIGYPNKYSPDYTLKLLNESLNKGKSLFFLASKDISYKKLKLIEKFLPFTVISVNPKEYTAFAEFSNQAINNPLIKINGEASYLEEWNKLPPLYRTELFVKSKPQSTVLAKVKVNDIVLNEPMIITGRNLEQRTLAILAYGIYRWELLGYAEEKLHDYSSAKDLFSAFIQNSTQWLTSDLNKKNVIIKPTHKSFHTNEKINFVAQVYDAVFNPINNANVKVKIINKKIVNEIELYSVGNGQYEGYIENLPPGEYFYKGNATLNNKILGKDRGKYTVGSIALEYRNFVLNKSLLTALSKRTNGKFYYNDKVENLIDDIKSNPNFKSRAVTLTNEIALWNLPIILGVVIFLFALEWFFRKRFGLL